MTVTKLQTCTNEKFETELGKLKKYTVIEDRIRWFNCALIRSISSGDCGIVYKLGYYDMDNKKAP